MSDNEEMRAGISILVASLNVYVKGKTAHCVRHYPERGEIYIFCNRFLGKFSGNLYNLPEYVHLKSQPAPLCEKCGSALQIATERFQVLCGKHPSELSAPDES